MNARTHDAFAFASLVTVAVYHPPQDLTTMTVFAAVVGNIVGSLIPDMDQAGNRLWDLLPIGNTLGKILRKVFYKHRTLTHSLLGAFLIYQFLNWILPKLLNPDFVNVSVVLWSIMIGYFSHLLADSFTKEGIPLLFPLKIDFGIPPIEFLRVTTGSWVENFVVLPGVSLYILWFLLRFQEELTQVLLLIN